MAKLSYTAITSLDGYIEDEEGRFDWAVPDAEVHAFVNDLERPIGTHLYGRRMYETMAVWQTIGDEPGVPAVEADYAELWRALDKVVYSRTLDAVSTPRTRLEREFDPEAVRRMKEAADRDISVSGPGLAAARVPGRAGGRGPPVRVPGRRGRRQAGAAPGRPDGPRAARRAAVRQRRGPPAPPHTVSRARALAPQRAVARTRVASIAAGARIASSTITAAPTMPAESPRPAGTMRSRPVASGSERR